MLPGVVVISYSHSQFYHMEPFPNICYRNSLKKILIFFNVETKACSANSGSLKCLRPLCCGKRGGTRHDPEVKIYLLLLMFGWLEGHTHDDGCQGLSVLFFPSLFFQRPIVVQSYYRSQKNNLKAENNNNTKNLI